MSLTIKSNVSAGTIAKFLHSEYVLESDIPVHLFSFAEPGSSYHQMLGITDNAGGTMFFESAKMFKAYGNNNPCAMIKALKLCNIKLSII